MFSPTNIAFICQILLHIFSTTDAYSVAVAGQKPTKEIIERDCMDPSFVPSYCPQNITDAKEEEGLAVDYTNKSEIKITDCLGFLSDAEDCHTEPGNDYANARQKYKKYKKIKRRGYQNKKSIKLKKSLTQIDTPKQVTSIESFLQSYGRHKLNKTKEESLDRIVSEMETECMGLPGDPDHCDGTTMNATEAPKTPETTRAADSFKFPKFPKSIKVSKAPKGPKTPKNPNTKYSVRKLNKYADELRGETETECLGLPTDPYFCHDDATGDYEMANGYGNGKENGDAYSNGKESSKGAIISKNGRLYLRFKATAETTKKHFRLKKMGESQDYGPELSDSFIVDPHEFPWVVRITGGCAKGDCGGALISPRLILSAYHCTYRHGLDDGTKPCDHSDGKRRAYLGTDVFSLKNKNRYDSIPIIDVIYPENQGYLEEDVKTHDIAMLVLQKPAKYSYKVKPICLPKQDQEFGGETATAAGFGMHEPSDVNPHQSEFLRKLDLTVDTKKYEHTKMFGTKLESHWASFRNRAIYKDPCQGDSGGPLMYIDPETGQYILIGTVMGYGYDCSTDTVKENEGSSNGLWNKVSAWVDWINTEMKEMGEKGCKRQEEYNEIYWFEGLGN